MKSPTAVTDACHERLKPRAEMVTGALIRSKKEARFHAVVRLFYAANSVEELLRNKDVNPPFSLALLNAAGNLVFDLTPSRAIFTVTDALECFLEADVPCSDSPFHLIPYTLYPLEKSTPFTVTVSSPDCTFALHIAPILVGSDKDFGGSLSPSQTRPSPYSPDSPSRVSRDAWAHAPPRGMVLQAPTRASSLLFAQDVISCSPSFRGPDTALGKLRIANGWPVPEAARHSFSQRTALQTLRLAALLSSGLRSNLPASVEIRSILPPFSSCLDFWWDDCEWTRSEHAAQEFEAEQSGVERALGLSPPPHPHRHSIVASSHQSWTSFVSPSHARSASTPTAAHAYALSASDNHSVAIATRAHTRAFVSSWLHRLRECVYAMVRQGTSPAPPRSRASLLRVGAVMLSVIVLFQLIRKLRRGRLSSAVVVPSKL